MVPLIKRSTSTLAEKVGEIAESGESTDFMKWVTQVYVYFSKIIKSLRRIYGEFTMESILAAAFGRVINIQRGEADEVTEAAKGIFAAGRNMKVQISVAILSKYKMYNVNNSHELYLTIYDLIISSLYSQLCFQAWLDLFNTIWPDRNFLNLSRSCITQRWSW